MTNVSVTNLKLSETLELSIREIIPSYNIPKFLNLFTIKVWFRKTLAKKSLTQQ